MALATAGDALGTQHQNGLVLAATVHALTDREIMSGLASGGWELGRRRWRDTSVLVRCGAGDHFAVSRFFEREPVRRERRVAERQEECILLLEQMQRRAPRAAWTEAGQLGEQRHEPFDFRRGEGRLARAH